MKLKRNLAPWQKVLAAFFSGQAASILGSGLVQFALIWYITYRTNSGVAIMVMTVASFLPQLLIALVSGVWADRYDRRWLIILSDGGIALASLVVALLFMRGYDHIWLIYIVSAVRSLGGGIQGPAITALIPQIVPQKSLVRCNGIYNTINNISLLLSPLLGGVMILIMPLWAIFFIDVGTAAIAIAIMFWLPLPQHESDKVGNALGHTLKDDDYDWGFPTEEEIAGSDGDDNLNPEYSIGTSRIQEFRDGLSYVNKKPFIKLLLTVYAFFMVLLAPIAVLLPLFVRRHFGTEVWFVTAAQVAIFAGMALGGVLVAAKGEFKSRVRTIRTVGLIISALTLVLATLGITNIDIFVLFALILFSCGLVIPFYTTAVTVLLQENVSHSYHGRVFALLYMVGSAAIPLGTLIFAPLADIIAIEIILFITASLQLLILFWSWKKFPINL